MNLNLNAYSYNKGIESFNNRDYEKAVEFMTNAMQENPWMKFLQAYKIRGFSYANLKDYKNAVSDFDIVIHSLKENSSEKESIANLYFARGQANNSLNNKKKAIEDFESCVRINQNRIGAYQQLFFLYNSMKDSENQLKSINKIIEIEPQAHWYTEKANILQSIDKVGYIAEIISNHKKSITLSPNMMPSYQGLAFIYFEAEKFYKAIDLFTKCIQLTGFEDFYYYRGLCYKGSGNIYKYTVDIKKSLELGFEEAKQEIENNTSLFASKNQMLFFDTETTGVPRNWKAPASDTKNWPRLVQLAWQLYDEQGTLLESKSAIIKPDNFLISKESSNVHGITTERAYVEGKDLTMILSEFESTLKEANLLIAHNMSFDEKIIGAEFYRLSNINPLLKIKKLCTMEKSTNICKIDGQYGYKWPKLEELHYFLFDKYFEDVHNAKTDIQATADCYFELKRRTLI